MLLGGTLGELLSRSSAPLYFYFHGQTLGFDSPLIIWFYSKFLYIGYLHEGPPGPKPLSPPLVNGDIGDWTLLFGSAPPPLRPKNRPSSLEPRLARHVRHDPG